MIYVISTAANTIDHYDLRKFQYLNGLKSIIENYNINPYIIETVAESQYLNEHFLGNSRYSDNKGVNELINIDNFFMKYSNKFKDNDDLIKTTLRYTIISPYLLETVKKNTHDIYCKSSSDIYGPQDIGIHTFLISMKYRCWREFLHNYFDRTVNKDDPIELQLSNYVRQKNTLFLDQLGIKANPWNLKQTFII